MDRNEAVRLGELDEERFNAKMEGDWKRAYEAEHERACTLGFNYGNKEAALSVARSVLQEIAASKAFKRLPKHLRETVVNVNANTRWM